MGGGGSLVPEPVTPPAVVIVKVRVRLYTAVEPVAYLGRLEEYLSRLEWNSEGQSASK